MTFIIAEIGVNHGGNIERAKYLIDAAKRSGADAVKFQTYDADKLEPPGQRRETLRELQLSKEDHFTLKDEAEDCGIEFMSTPFDPESLAFLAGDLGIKKIKLSSGAMFDHGLLRSAEGWRRPIILSTGMGDNKAIGEAVRILKYAELSLLHCVSSYPTPTNELNLRAVKTLKEFGVPVGLSDHSLSLVAPAIAVSMGAVIIEKHLTANRGALGPDHRASLEPDEFKKMVEYVRESETSLGDGAKTMRMCEVGTWKIIKEREAHRPSIS